MSNHLTELDKRSIRRIYQLLGQQFGISELGRIRLEEFLRDENDNSWTEDLNAGWHHMGTTRMSDDPKRGVVTANCQVHAISNLYVAGSGCYVTSGAPKSYTNVSRFITAFIGLCERKNEIKIEFKCSAN